MPIISIPAQLPTLGYDALLLVGPEYFTNMKKLLYLFVFLFVLLPLTRAADSAYDLILLQQNSANTGKVQVNITPVASSLVGFNASKLPVNIALGTNLSLSGTTLNATGGGTPAGSSGDIQTNSSGAFGHITPGANIVTFLTSALPTTLSGYGITNGVANTVTVNGHALSSNVTVTNSDLGAVPTTTTVNGHALSSNVTVTNGDLGAVPTTTTVNGHALSSNVTVTTGDLGLGTMATQAASAVAITGGTINFTPATASAGGTVVLSNGSDIYISAFTSSTSFTLPASTAGNYFRLHLEGCDGSSTATFSGTVNRNGYNTSGTVYTPAPAGNHVVYGRYINGAWYESDDFSSNTLANGATGGTTAISATNSLTPASSALTEASNAVTMDTTVSNTFSLTLNANLTTVTLSNFADNQTIVAAITNTASNYTVTWGNSIKWVGASQPVQTVGAHTDVWTLKKVGTTIYGSVVQNF